MNICFIGNRNDTKEIEGGVEAMIIAIQVVIGIEVIIYKFFLFTGLKKIKVY